MKRALARCALGRPRVALAAALSPARNAAALGFFGGSSLRSLGLGLERRGHGAGGSLLFDLGGCSADGCGVGGLYLARGNGGGGRRNSLRLRWRLGRRQLTVRIARRQSVKRTLLTLARRLSVNLGARSVALVNTLVLLAHILRHSTATADGRLVAKVGVNADEIALQTESADVFYDNLARRLGFVVGAVAAAAVQLACVDDGEVLDRYCAGAVVLDDFVDCFLRTATDDGCVACAEDGDSIFADVAEPDVSQGAGSFIAVRGVSECVVFGGLPVQ